LSDGTSWFKSSCRSLRYHMHIGIAGWWDHFLWLGLSLFHQKVLNGNYKVSFSNNERIEGGICFLCQKWPWTILASGWWKLKNLLWIYKCKWFVTEYQLCLCGSLQMFLILCWSSKKMFLIGWHFKSSMKLLVQMICIIIKRCLWSPIQRFLI
jgi:hypothetical protein